MGDARKEIILCNLKLVKYIANRFDNTRVEREDLISIGTIGLIKAVNTFDMNRNIRLSTYAARCIENEILMYLRKNRQDMTEISINEPILHDTDGNELIISDIIAKSEKTMYDMSEEAEKIFFLRKAVDSLRMRDKRIISMRYGLGEYDAGEKTQQEVADILGISQSYISRREKMIIKILKNKIQKYSQ